MVKDYPDRQKGEGSLGRQEQIEFDTVRKAVEQTKTMIDGKNRIQVISMTLWKRTHTVDGSAIALHLSERTAQRYRWQFVALVGMHYGFLTCEEYQELVRRDAGNEKRNPVA